MEFTQHIMGDKTPDPFVPWFAQRDKTLLHDPMLPLLTRLDDKVRLVRERADALKAAYDRQVAAASTPPVGTTQDHIMDRGTVGPFVSWFAPLDETVNTDCNLPFLIRLDNEVRTALERADELKVAYDRQVAEDARQGSCNWGAYNAAQNAYRAATQSLASAMAHRREVWRDRWERQLPRTRQAYEGVCDSLGNAIEERRDAWEKRSLRRVNQNISRIGRALLLLVLSLVLAPVCLTRIFDGGLVGGILIFALLFVPTLWCFVHYIRRLGDQ